MGVDLRIMDLFKETGIMDAQFEDGPAKSLEEIEGILAERRLNVVEVQLDKDGPNPLRDGNFLYLCTPKGTVVVSLDTSVGLPPKPDSYKDGGRARVIGIEPAPIHGVPIPVHNRRYVGVLPRKPDAYKG